MSVRSGQFEKMHELIDALMALKPAPYLPLKADEFDPNLGHKVDMGCAGITSARSPKPLIGTCALETCLGVALFNTVTREGGIAHLAQDEIAGEHLAPYSETSLKSLLTAIRDKKEDTLQARLVGTYAGTVSDTFCGEVLGILNAEPNLEFLSADFRGKDYSPNVAVDTRRWSEGLVKGKTDIRDIRGKTGEQIKNSFMHVVPVREMPDAPFYNDEGLFDGRGKARGASAGQGGPAQGGGSGPGNG